MKGWVTRTFDPCSSEITGGVFHDSAFAFSWLSDWWMRMQDAAKIKTYRRQQYENAIKCQRKTGTGKTGAMQFTTSATFRLNRLISDRFEITEQYCLFSMWRARSAIKLLRCIYSALTEPIFALLGVGFVLRCFIHFSFGSFCSSSPPSCFWQFGCSYVVPIIAYIWQV